MTELRDRPQSALREFLAPMGGLAIGIVCLAVWWFAKASLMMSWWGGFPFFFMPAAVGFCVGGVMRILRREGTFGVAGLAVLITVIVSCVGMGMQHWFNVNKRVQNFADAAYDETLKYAKTATSISDDKILRQTLTNQVAVVGRFAARDLDLNQKDFWLWRNYLHFHWIAARQIIVYGQGGADKTIWEATKVFKNNVFFDDIVRSASSEDVTDDDVSNFEQMELPFLRKMANGKISRDDFENPLVAFVRTKLSFASMPSRGFDPFTGGFIVLGCIIAYKLVRESSEEEMI